MPHIVSPELHDVVLQTGGLHGLNAATDQIRIELVRPLLQHVDIDVHGGHDPPDQVFKSFRPVGVFLEFIKLSECPPLRVLCCCFSHNLNTVSAAGGQSALGELQHGDFYAEILGVGRFEGRYFTFLL